MSTVARAARDNQKMAYSLNPAIAAASSASLTGSCSLTLVWSSSTGGVRIAPNRPAARCRRATFLGGVARKP